jgi:hypothetical protein
MEGQPAGPTPPRARGDNRAPGRAAEHPLGQHKRRHPRVISPSAEPRKRGAQVSDNRHSAKALQPSARAIQVRPALFFFGRDSPSWMMAHGCCISMDLFLVFLRCRRRSRLAPATDRGKSLKNNQETQNIGISHADTLSLAYSAARFGR